MKNAFQQNHHALIYGCAQGAAMHASCSLNILQGRRGRVGGRPKALDEADLKKARALLRSGDYSKVQVAHELEVSRHTLWRALSLDEKK